MLLFDVLPCGCLCPWSLKLLTLLEPRSRFGDKVPRIRLLCPQNGTAILKGLTVKMSVVVRKACTKNVGTYHGSRFHGVNLSR